MQTEIYFNSNIKFLRKRKKRTQDDVAQTLNLTRPSLSGYENNVAQPGIETLMAFSDYFNISIDTLVRVDLKKLSESQLSEIERGYDVFLKGGQLRVLATTVDSDNTENIELVPEKAKAGYTQGFADPEFISDLPAFKLPFLASERKYRTFQISGDSMLPIPDKSWVTAEFILNWQSIETGKAYIILTLDEGVVFKIIENYNAEAGELLLKSLNPVYEPYIITVNEIREIWKFTHYISSEMPDTQKSPEEIYRLFSTLKNDIEVVKNRLGSQ